MGKRWRQIIFFFAAFFLLRGIQLGLIGDVEIGRSIYDFFSEDKSDRNVSFQHATTPVVPFSEVMLTRRRLLTFQCSTLKPGPQGKISLISLHLSNLVPDNAASRPEWLLYCPVYKAASSNWFHRMTLLSGGAYLLKPGAALDQVAWKVTGSKGRPWRKIQQLISGTSHSSFIVVRNPMDRLVSAYRNKLECRAGKEYYYKEHGKKAVQSYRKAGKLKFGEERYKKMRNSHQDCHTEVEPSFWEFVQYVLAHPTGDPHWKPFTQVCSVCSVTYDYILHFENLDVEEEEMLQELGLREAFPPLRLNAVKKVEGEETSVTESYIQMLMPEDWKSLVSLYSRDAVMFGYDQQIEQLDKSLQEKWRANTQQPMQQKQKMDNLT